MGDDSSATNRRHPIHIQQQQRRHVVHYNGTGSNFIIARSIQHTTYYSSNNNNNEYCVSFGVTGQASIQAIHSNANLRAKSHSPYRHVGVRECARVRTFATDADTIPYSKEYSDLLYAPDNVIWTENACTASISGWVGHTALSIVRCCMHRMLHYTPHKTADRKELQIHMRDHASHRQSKVADIDTNIHLRMCVSVAPVYVREVNICPSQSYRTDR